MKVTMEMLREKKGVDRLPLLKQATESLQSASAKYGYAHVQKTYKDQYFCYYKGINTGLQPTPMLAALELIKQAKKKGIEITDKLEIDYYPECFFLVPKVDLAAIEYLKEPCVRAMYKGVKLREAKGVRTFVCDIVLDNVAYRSSPHPTPMEAVFAVHTGKVKLKAAVYMPPEDVKGPADLSVIQHMRCDTGYKGVRCNSENQFMGIFSVHGVKYYTKRYKSPEEAAWALYHQQLVAPSLDTWEKKIADQTTGLKLIRSKLMNEYREAKEDFEAYLKADDETLLKAI